MPYEGFADVQDKAGNIIRVATLPEEVARVTIFQRTVTLTDEQVRTLPTSPDMELVPAPGAGKFLELIRVMLRANTVEAYDDVDNGRLLFVGRESDEGTAQELLFGLNGGLLNSGGPLAWWTIAHPGNAGAATTNDFTNRPIRLGTDQQVDFTAGDPDNTLDATVWYAVVDV